MHYYKKNLGDYAKKTGRLSLLQHGAYTLLIDACYDREQFPTLDDAIDWLLPVNEDEKEAIEFVLKRFFTLEGDVYVQARIKEEIEGYKDKSLKNKEIAQDREKAKRTKRERSVNELDQDREPNQEPRTTNQEPLTKNQSDKEKINKKNLRPKVDYSVWVDMPSDDVFEDWLRVRKSKKALVTQTAVNAIGKELAKAKGVGFSVDDCFTMAVERNWVGFKADWMVNSDSRVAEKPKDVFVERFL